MPDLLERLQAALAGRYAVESEIGRGGMATVYLAEDLRHDRPVAVKVLHPDLAASVGGERFLREIEIAASLAHPHVLSLIDSGEAGGLFYYVMPYVVGESLRDRLQREQQLPIEEAVRIGKEVADGLGHAHRQGVIHRDIKPANIMLSDGHALIADFGVARAAGSEGTALTRTGVAVGTPAYMSPEQAAGAEEVDARSDVYSLGCVIYEMLAGEPPLTGATPQAIASRRLTETATSLPVLRETVPGGLDRVVSKALARTRVDRYPTGAELAAALASPALWEDAKPRRKIGRRVVEAGIAIVLLGAGVYLSQFFAGRGPAVETDPDLVAVLPLVSATGGDTTLENLGHAVAARISADLDGIGMIRTADYATIRATEEATAGTPEDAAEWAHGRVGAGQVVQGTLTRVAADEVGIDLALYDRDRTLLARATFTGRPGEPWALADSLTWRLLDQVWSAGGAGTRDYYYRGLLRGRPFTAVREYMTADRRHWDRAGDGTPRTVAETYERAYRADTTLWMASFMYDHVTTSGSFVDPGVRDPLVASAWRGHVGELPPPYQLWIEAWELPYGRATIERLQEMLRPSGVIPRGNFGPIQYRLADLLIHGGRVHGYPAEYMIDLAKAAIEAGFGAELYDVDHLMRAALGRDEAATQLWLDYFLRLGMDQTHPELYRFYRLITRHLTGQTDPILMDSVAADFDAGSDADWDLFRTAGTPDLAIDLYRRRSPPETDPKEQADRLFREAWLWADRGAWDSVLVVIREGQALECASCVVEYWVAAVGEWLGAIPSGSAGEFRPRMATQIDEWGDECPDCGIWLASIDGLVASARRDSLLLHDALRRVDAAEGGERVEAIAMYVARSLRAAELELRGDRRAAGDSLEALLGDHPYPPRVPGDGYGHVEAFNRLSGGRWLRAEGDASRARSVLLGLQLPEFGRRSSDDWELVTSVSGLAYLELARIEESIGQSARARDYYEQFLRRYDMPVESHRPLVEEAREAHVRLGGDPGKFD